MKNKDKDLKAWLETVPDLDTVLDELDHLDVPDIENDPEFQADLLKGAVTEGILRAMEEKEVNRNQLSKLMGKSRQYVGHSLNENANFTLKRLAEFAVALGRKVAIVFHQKDEVVKVCRDESKWKPERQWQPRLATALSVPSGRVKGRGFDWQSGKFQETSTQATDVRGKSYDKFQSAA